MQNPEEIERRKKDLRAAAKMYEEQVEKRRARLAMMLAPLSPGLH